ncbi:1-hydroxy-2-methyl-2-butenyl 4-diphosphate reductase [Kutzneria buriramensis]|uniref:4-hydroxy-3-methylbut-2-enyl diphosphate reductase n=1 Tax=Kutzneria buriramensis TaxID=1045776 RepID=A0A3E0HGK7_9PSEU|nr:1-hydroxy-2-methyl-2-butenyl 4-diphosphate reductase [Kutzneria buriramensis]REH44888.1 4-hydroxy-3-methylbut-2-enyl diphosphate reductase [Kutzneria buriramensis]
MADLVVATALRIERFALRRGLPDVPVIAVGMGIRHPSRLSVPPGAALVVAGVAGAVVAGLEPGDLVVDDRDLALSLRGNGFTVHHGVIADSDHVVGSAERAELARTGALAVDMESAGLLALAGDRPHAVVRAIVDTPSRALLRPATLGGGIAALRRLAAIGPVLRHWAESKVKEVRQ